MAVNIEWRHSVHKDLEKMDPAIARRIVLKIERELTLESRQHTPLSGLFAGFYRLRVGDYRVIYVRTATGYGVARIGHRREVYRQGPPEVQ